MSACAPAATQLLLDCERVWEEIDKFMNLSELADALLKHELVGVRDLKRMLNDNQQFIVYIQHQGSKTVQKFLSCFQPDGDHLGHDYIACLVRKQPFSNERMINASQRYQKFIKSNFKLTRCCLNFDYLLHVMVAKRLVTEDEMKRVKEESGTKQQLLNVLDVLDTKGPTAYALFVKCIDEEMEHLGHKDFLKKINEEMKSESLQPSMIFNNSPTTELTGYEYHRRRIEFESHYHNGKWSAVSKLATECMRSEKLELQIIGRLELALGQILWKNESNLLTYIDQAESIAISLDNNNSQYLEARCHYLRSLHFFYNEKLDQAEAHVIKAKLKLFYADVGEDKSFAAYCDAIVATGKMAANPDSQSFDKVAQLLEASIQYSTEADVKVLTTYSYLRLLRLYLDNTECMAQSKVVGDKRLAECQAILQTNYDVMGDRCRCLLRIVEYDICMRSGDRAGADEAIRSAKALAKKCDCRSEIEAATMRYKQSTTPRDSLSSS